MRHTQNMPETGENNQQVLNPQLRPDRRERRRISVKTATLVYPIAAAVGAFFAAYLYYLDFEIAALVLSFLSLLTFPFLAYLDRIVFDGKRISRTGPIWQIASLLTGNKARVKPKNIVHVETEALRALKRGRRVIYRYRTVLEAEDAVFTIGSGRGFREMIATLLPLVPESSLDVRSVELRDHLKDAAEAKEQASKLQIPASEVLDPVSLLDRNGRHTRANSDAASLTGDVVRADELRVAANQLKMSGYLVQAIEAFRRAMLLNPVNPRLIYEFARCLQSFAASERDPRLDRKAHALMRLAERRSGTADGDLLARLGESYLGLGDWRRAEIVFRKAADRAGDRFRVLCGLAELALRDEKIAHAIHHFSNAANLPLPASLRRWAQSEADYFLHLNNSDEYTEVEIGRVSLLETLERFKRTSLRIFFIALPLIPLGFVLEDEPFVELGWAVSAVSLLIWTGLAVARRAFLPRIPFDLVDEK